MARGAAGGSPAKPFPRRTSPRLPAPLRRAACAGLQPHRNSASFALPALATALVQAAKYPDDVAAVCCLNVTSGHKAARKLSKDRYFKCARRAPPPAARSPARPAHAFPLQPAPTGRSLWREPQVCGHLHRRGDGGGRARPALREPLRAQPGEQAAAALHRRGACRRRWWSRERFTMSPDPGPPLAPASSPRPAAQPSRPPGAHAQGTFMARMRSWGDFLQRAGDPQKYPVTGLDVRCRAPTGHARRPPPRPPRRARPVSVPR